MAEDKTEITAFFEGLESDAQKLLVLALNLHGTSQEASKKTEKEKVARLRAEIEKRAKSS